MKFDQSRPIWLQLYEEFLIQIVTGKWPPGSKIPSVRDIAVTLTVNPNTLQKTFGELEKIGLVQTERAAARFVTKNENFIAEQRVKMADTMVKSYVNTVKRLGFSLSSALEMIEKIWKNSESDNDIADNVPVIEGQASKGIGE